MISPFIPLFSPFRGPPLKLYSFPLLLLHPFYILFIQLQLFPLSSTLLSFITHHTPLFHLTPFFHFSPSPYSTLPLPLYSPTSSPLSPSPPLSHITSLYFISLHPFIPYHPPLYSPSPLLLYPTSLPSIPLHIFIPSLSIPLFQITPSPLFHSLHPFTPCHSCPLFHITLFYFVPLPHLSFPFSSS